MDRLEREFSGQITVLRLNAGDPTNAQLQADYGLRGHPAFVLLNEDNQVVGRSIGPQAEGVLRDALTGLVGD